MASAYPGAVDTLTNPVASDTMDSVSVPHATQHAGANDAIEAIETELGANPSGASVDVATRLGLLATLASPTFTGTVTLPDAVVITVANAVAASATQTQSGGTALTKAVNRVTTVATADDAVTLPAATAGKVVKVKNAHATNQIGVFPALGDAVNAAAANAVYALPALKMVEFNCAVAGTWDTILTA